MHIKILIPFSCMLVFISFAFSVQAAENWVAEEIFKQIAELKRDNNQLRKKVEQLKTQMSQFKKGSARNKKTTNVSLDDDFKLGEHRNTAKVAIVEFSDFECPL